MCAEGFTGGVGVVGADGLDNGVVSFDGGGQIFAKALPFHGNEGEEGDGELVEDLVEGGIAGAAPDGAMEFEIGVGGFEVVVGGDRTGDGLQPVFDFL